MNELVQDFYSTFIDVDLCVIFDLISAADFMDIPPLRELASAAVAIAIHGATSPKICQLFGGTIWSDKLQILSVEGKEFNNAPTTTEKRTLKFTQNIGVEIFLSTQLYFNLTQYSRCRSNCHNRSASERAGALHS